MIIADLLHFIGGLIERVGFFIANIVDCLGACVQSVFACVSRRIVSHFFELFSTFVAHIFNSIGTLFKRVTGFFNRAVISAGSDESKSRDSSNQCKFLHFNPPVD